MLVNKNINGCNLASIKLSFSFILFMASSPPVTECKYYLFWLICSKGAFTSNAYLRQKIKHDKLLSTSILIILYFFCQNTCSVLLCCRINFYIQFILIVGDTWQYNIEIRSRELSMTSHNAAPLERTNWEFLFSFILLTLFSPLSRFFFFFSFYFFFCFSFSSFMLYMAFVPDK